MSLSIIPISQIFVKYEQQVRIAELNRKTPIRTIQNYADRVTISKEARQAQVLRIARAVREASGQLELGTKKPEEIKLSSTGVEEKNTKDISNDTAKVKDASGEADSIKKLFVEKSLEINDKNAKESKKSEEKESTPF